MSELSQESSRSNKDGNRRVTVAFFSTAAQEETEPGACTIWQERGVLTDRWVKRCKIKSAPSCPGGETAG